MKHIWVCGYCGRSTDFRQPEKQDSDPTSEMNESKQCFCGEYMCYEDAPTAEELEGAQEPKKDFQQMQRDFFNI